MTRKQLFTSLLFLCFIFSTQAQNYNPYKSIHKSAKVLTLSKGKYDEFFDTKDVQRIGTVLYNSRTKKIVKLLNVDSVYKKASDNSSVSRWYSPDPLAAKFSQYSPYVFVANNPIRYNDPDGQELVDPNGKHISVSFNKNGTLSFSKNATADVKRIANALNLTETGRTQLKGAMSSDIKVKMNISQETNITTESDGVHRTYGETQQGNPNSPPAFGQKVNPDGTMAITEATVTIYEGTINQGIQDGSGLKHEGLTMEEAIAAVAGHEIVHATDKTEINKDLQETQGKPRKDSRETKPNSVENKIIEQSKKLNQ